MKERMSERVICCFTHQMATLAKAGSRSQKCDPGLALSGKNSTTWLPGSVKAGSWKLESDLAIKPRPSSMGCRSIPCSLSLENLSNLLRVESLNKLVKALEEDEVVVKEHRMTQECARSVSVGK